MKSFEVFSDVKPDGKLQKNASGVIAYNLNLLIGKRVRVLIEVVKNTRSHRQNRYYWGCVIPEQIDCFKDKWGEVYTKDQIHDWNKANIWHEEKIDTETGEVFNIPGTSKVTVGQFEERLEMLRQFFEKKFEWKIPLPNENIKLDLE